ncbi:MAG: YkgJ family cysteine cluster protein, partial [Phycisphaeraceae bacterium]|nr:YkgJ family cysteine cluster protein [Phycisphaeraceae bacterium]
TFLKHKPNGDCIFLNSDNGLCQIHEQFGESEKPLGCQLFPFQLHRTFKDKVTLIPRHDCPSVRQNKGDRYKANQLTKIAEKLLADQDPISKQQRCGLNEDQIQAIVDFLTALLPSLQTPAHKALFLHSFCGWLSHQEASELSRQTLGQLYQPLVEHVNQWVDDMQNKKFRKVDRFAFANLIAMYLRRDEDVLDKRVGRGKRAAKILLFGLGLATINDLGSMYPPPRKFRHRKFRHRKFQPRKFNPRKFKK